MSVKLSEKFGFSTRIDDLGRVTVGGIIRVSAEAESKSWSDSCADHYFDVFSSLPEAKKARGEAINA